MMVARVLSEFYRVEFARTGALVNSRWEKQLDRSFLYRVIWQLAFYCCTFARSGSSRGNGSTDFSTTQTTKNRKNQKRDGKREREDKEKRSYARKCEVSRRIISLRIQRRIVVFRFRKELQFLLVFWQIISSQNLDE